MITYRAIQATPSGDLNINTQGNVLGVFDEGVLRAVYIHNPSTATRVKTFTLFAGIFAVASCLFLWAMTVVQAPYYLISMLLFSGVVGLALWLIALPQMMAIEDAESIETSLRETQSEKLDIITDKKVLFIRYPVEEFV